MVSLYDSHFALTGWPTGQFEHSEQICRSWFQYCPSVQIRAFAHDAKQDTSSTVMTDTITWKEQGKGYLQPKNETYRFLRISTIESCPFALDRSLMQRFAIDFFLSNFYLPTDTTCFRSGGDHVVKFFYYQTTKFAST